MKVIILAGGFGTRLSEYTESIPKPMVSICGKPIIWHIMEHYAKFGFKEFVIALGYKAEIIKDYFLKSKTLNSDFTIDLTNGEINLFQSCSVDWKITLIDTGLNTMTGGRIKRVQEFIGNKPFMLTYGDGLADVDIGNLVKFHNAHNKMVTVTAVRPIARFGELEIKNDKDVVSFQEKPQVDRGWINGGFFVCQPDVFSYIEDDSSVWEREPLEKITNENHLCAYKHFGFWQCMDTKRDKDLLEKILSNVSED